MNLAAALLALSTLVLGHSVPIGSVDVRRTSLSGYRVAGQTLDIEDAAAAVASAAQREPALPSRAVAPPAAPAPTPTPTTVPLARRIANVISRIWRDGDVSPTYHYAPLAGGGERVEVRYNPSVRQPGGAEEWMGRAAAALRGAGMIVAVEGAKMVVMERRWV